MSARDTIIYAAGIATPVLGWLVVRVVGELPSAIDQIRYEREENMPRGSTHLRPVFWWMLVRPWQKHPHLHDDGFRPGYRVGQPNPKYDA